MERQGIAGKFDALEIAQRDFPALACWDVIDEILHANYGVPKWYRSLLFLRLKMSWRLRCKSLP